MNFMASDSNVRPWTWQPTPEGPESSGVTLPSFATRSDAETCWESTTLSSWIKQRHGGVSDGTGSQVYGPMELAAG
jgi:hypothetical protein